MCDSGPGHRKSDFHGISWKMKYAVHSEPVTVPSVPTATWAPSSSDVDRQAWHAEPTAHVKQTRAMDMYQSVAMLFAIISIACMLKASFSTCLGLNTG